MLCYNPLESSCKRHASKSQDHLRPEWGGTAVLPHIDYDLTISKDDKQVFQTSALAGHPNHPLHTTEGIVTIQQGAYIMNSLRDSLQSNKT